MTSTVKRNSRDDLGGLVDNTSPKVVQLKDSDLINYKYTVKDNKSRVNLP